MIPARSSQLSRVTVSELVSLRKSAADPDVIYRQLSANYPPDSIAWVRKIPWAGPVGVPLADIDWDSVRHWAAAHQEHHVEDFVKLLSDGKAIHPVVAVRTPGDSRVKIIDGHHRALAYRKLNRPVRAYVGSAPSDDESAPWFETHLYQEHQGSSAANKRYNPAEPRNTRGEWSRTGDDLWQTDEGTAEISSADKEKIGKNYYGTWESEITQNILRYPEESAAVGLTLGEGAQKLKDAISHAEPFRSPVTVHRGFTDARSLFGKTGSHIGMTVTERGFLSTTASPEKGDAYRGYSPRVNSAVVHIHVPAGVRALKVTQDFLPARTNAPGTADRMQEYTFTPGTRLHVVSDEKTGTGKRAHREITVNLVPSQVDKRYNPAELRNRHGEWATSAGVTAPARSIFDELDAPQDGQALRARLRKATDDELRETIADGLRRKDAHPEIRPYKFDRTIGNARGELAKRAQRVRKKAERAAQDAANVRVSASHSIVMNLDGVDEQLKPMITQRVKVLAERYPYAASRLKQISAVPAADMKDTTIALTEPGVLFSSVKLNLKYFSDFHDLQRTVLKTNQTGFHPLDTMMSIIDHEFGHVIDNSQFDGRRSSLPSAQAAWSSSSDVRRLSGYALKNTKEAFAEGFAVWQSALDAGEWDPALMRYLSLGMREQLQGISERDSALQASFNKSERADVLPAETCDGYVPVAIAESINDDDDELTSQPGDVMEPVFSTFSSGGKLKIRLADLVKVGPEGYIHGWICVRPPCGGKYSEARRESHGGKTIDPHGGIVIGRDLKKNAGDAGYRIRYVNPRNGSKTELAGQYTTRRDASKALVAYHNLVVLHRAAVNNNADQLTQDYLRDARDALARGDHNEVIRLLSHVRRDGGPVIATHADEISGVLAHEIQWEDPGRVPDPVVMPEGEWRKASPVARTLVSYTSDRGYNLKDAATGYTIGHVTSESRMKPNREWQNIYTAVHADGTRVYRGTSVTSAEAHITSHHNGQFPVVHASEPAPAPLGNVSEWMAPQRISVLDHNEVVAREVSDGAHKQAAYVPNLVARTSITVKSPKSSRDYGTSYGIGNIHLNPQIFSTIVGAERAQKIVDWDNDSGWWSGGDREHSLADQVIAHEFGHGVYYSLYQGFKISLWRQVAEAAHTSAPPTLLHLDWWVKNNRKSFKNNVSKYATTSIDELAAELWSEYTMKKNPRPPAKAYGDFIMRYLGNREEHP